MTSMAGGAQIHRIVTVYGSDTVGAGNNNDTINIGGSGNTTFGGGNDSLSAGNDTVLSSFGQSGSATVAGGELIPSPSASLTGHETMIGGFHQAEFVGGTVAVGSDSIVGGFVPSTTFTHGAFSIDTIIGASGGDTLVGGIGKNVFEFPPTAAGTHLITNFVSGQDQLYLEGNSLAYLESVGQVTSKGGNTIITLDGGKTSIELQGVTHLKPTDVITHKP